MTENDVLVNHPSSFIDTTFTPHKYNHVYDIYQMETYREQTEIIGEMNLNLIYVNYLNFL